MSRKHHHQRPFDEELVTELLQKRLRKDDPTAHFKDALYGRLMRQRVHGQHGKSPAPWRMGSMFGWMMSVALACLVLLIGTGITTTYAYVSPSVTRQSSLYALKLIVERAEIALVSSPEDRARSLLKFAKRRTDELRTLSRNGKLDTETLASIVRYTEEALAQADEESDASTQSDIRALVATEASDQRAILQEIIASLRIGSKDDVEDMTLLTDTPASAYMSEEETSTLHVSTEEMEAYEKTITQVGTVEVQALQKNIEREPSEAVTIPADLAIIIPKAPESTAYSGKEVTLMVAVRSTGTHRIDTSTVTIEWGDGQTEATNIDHLTSDVSKTLTMAHAYREHGTYMIRIFVRPKGDAEEWTTANNRESFAIRILRPYQVCIAGSYRCAENRTIEICDEDTYGETDWSKHRVCAENETCNNGTCVQSQCVSTCSREGSTQCNSDGKSIDMCERRGACLQWRPDSICANGCVSPGACLTAQPNTYKELCGNGIVSAFEECDDGNTVSGDGCSSICKREATCVDDDGGNDPKKQGTVRGAGTETDFCQDLNTLMEFTCSTAGSPFASRINCPFGCRSGICNAGPVCGNSSLETGEQCDDGNKINNDGCSATCMKESSNTCIDSDGGYVPTVRGTATVKTLQATDFCSADGTLREYKCAGPDSITSTTYTCANTCENGACVPATNICGNRITEVPEQCDDGNTVEGDGCSSTCRTEFLCIDSDNGAVPGTKGTVTQESFAYSDSCASPTTVTEFICRTPFQFSSSVIACANGCQNGACNPAPAPVCGNGTIEGNEQCDDGNTVSEDGCNATCQSENAKVSLRFTFIDTVMNTPVGGVHDYRNNQLQSDANGILTIEGSRLGISWIFEKGCYGYAFARIEKNVEGKALALIIDPFDGAKRVIDITGKNDVDVSVVSGNIPMYPFARFALASDQPVSFSLSYDLKNSIGTIPLAQSQKTNYQFHPGIPRGYEAKNLQVTDASNAMLSCPSFTPPMTYDPSICKAALLTVQGGTCSWSEQ